VRLVISINLADSFFAILFGILAALLLVHRILWPFVNQSFYRFATESSTRRKILICAGIVLLGFIGRDLTAAIRDLIKAFAG
jgi:hypothetical protein